MSQTVLTFYEELGFEEIEVDDNLTALFYELTEEGTYALITNDDGLMPESLEDVVIFACYREDGAYIWSASFEDSHDFAGLWQAGNDVEEKLAAIERHRQEQEL